MVTCDRILELYRYREPESKIIDAFREIAVDNRDKTYGNRTPLHLACEFADDRAVRILLERGADFNAKNNEGNTPLCILGMCRYEFADEEKIGEAAKLLLAAGASVPRSAEKTTALIEAVRNRHFSMAEVIVDSGSKIDSTDMNGENVLHLTGRIAGDISSEICRTEEYIAYVTEGKYPQKKIDETQKKLIILQKQEESIFKLAKKLLESALIDPEDKSDTGKTALDLAIEGGYATKVGSLLSGNDPEKNELYAQAGGMDIFQALFYKNRTALDTLLRLGVELQTSCEHENMSHLFGRISPLSCALASSNFEAAEMILNAGADPDYRMPDERTAFAVWVGNNKSSGNEEQYLRILELMTQCGWNHELSVDKAGNTALSFACSYVSGGPGKAAIQYLLKNGAETNIVNLCGQTPLMILYGGRYWDGYIPILPTLPRSYPYGLKHCGSDEAEILEILLEAGADSSGKDNWGNTLLHYIAAGCNETESKKATEILLDFVLPDVDAVNNEGLTAIDIATAKNNEALVKFLLKNL